MSEQGSLLFAIIVALLATGAYVGREAFSEAFNGGFNRNRCPEDRAKYESNLQIGAFSTMGLSGQDNCSSGINGVMKHVPYDAYGTSLTGSCVPGSENIFNNSVLRRV